jgi:hypothetical protein
MWNPEVSQAVSILGMVSVTAVSRKREILFLKVEVSFIFFVLGDCTFEALFDSRLDAAEEGFGDTMQIPVEKLR